MYTQSKKTICLLLFLLLQVGTSFAAHRHINGIVRDSLTLEGLPYSSITLNGTSGATLTNAKGLFEMNVPAETSSLTVSCQGYKQKTIQLQHSDLNLYDIALSPESMELEEVVIKKKKYSKKNNPAVDFMQRIRHSKGVTDPKRNAFYSYERYERISFGINNFDTTATNRAMQSMPYLKQHIDSSEIDGAPVLNISVKERAASYNYRHSPTAEKTTVHGIKSNGLDEFIEQENTQAILDELLRDIELYNSDIKLMRNTFVSPLSTIAPDFYRFYLIDSAAVVTPKEGKHIVLAFYPRNKASFGFKGHIYVPANDSTMFVRRVEMEVCDDVNINYVNSLKIVQDYAKADDNSRLKINDNLFAKLQLIPGTPEIYLSRKNHFSNHSFEAPDSADVIFNRLGSTFIEPAADSRDSIFWERARTVEIPHGESRIELLMKRLRSNRSFYWGEQVLKVLERGYIPTSNKSKFDYGPVNTTASYNSLEGFRFRAGGYTTANLNPHFFARGYIAYGVRDKKLKYQLEGEYSFNEKKYHPAEFPVHSLKIMHRYDVDRLGAQYLYTNADNFVLSFGRSSGNRFTYKLETEGTYTLELNNNFSVAATLSHVREEASHFVAFIDGNGRNFTHYNQSGIEVKLRYAPSEKFFQSRSHRIPVNFDAPTIELSHYWSPKSVGSTFNVNRTELTFSKDFSLSILGKLRTRIAGGHTWGASPFPELFIPNANLSFTIQPASFALMNPMEFINSSYASWHISWHLRGALFNLIPGFKKLHLREIISFNGLYGTLDKRNNPAFNNELFAFPQDAATQKMSKPYMEISAGLDNIFTILRVDYVWRLNYRNVPYSIDRSGIRVAMHFTF